MPASLPSQGSHLGEWVQLALLSEDDLDELAAILLDPEVYRHGYVMHRRPSSHDDARELARSRFLAGQGGVDGRGGGRNVYAVRLTTDTSLGTADTFVGTTALMQADVHNESIHLGSTLYGPRWWTTVVNPETKLLLLTHCFEECGYGRVKIQTDAANIRSAGAIMKLGGIREGILRRDTRREDGTFRDTVVFSILSTEWPHVKQQLLDRLKASHSDLRRRGLVDGL